MERGCDPPFIRRCGGPVNHGEGGGPGGRGGVRVKGGREGAIGYCPPCGLAGLQSLGGDPIDPTSRLRSVQSSPGLWESENSTVRDRNLDNGDGIAGYLHDLRQWSSWPRDKRLTRKSRSQLSAID